MNLKDVFQEMIFRQTDLTKNVSLNILLKRQRQQAKS